MYKKNRSLRSIELGFVMVTLAGLTVFGCGTDGNGSSNSTGSGSSTSSSGGGNSNCIDPTTYADVLTVKDEGFCVVASYDVDAVDGALTWGRHGGPMYVAPSMTPAGSIALTRLKAPDTGTSGKLTAGTNIVDMKLPMGSYLGSQVLDLPFFNWTLVSYTNADQTGAIIMFEGNNILLNYSINGFFSGTPVGTNDTDGRLIYTGLTAIFKTQMNENALYAADTCGTAMNKPRLVPDGDATCGDALAIEKFGANSGPVTADTAGNVFVVMSLGTGDQEAHGYPADAVKRGAGPATGTSMFKVPGFAGSLAAIPPVGTGAGVVVFQPEEYDMASMMVVGKDVIAQRFTVDAGAIVNQGVAGPFMTPTAMGEVLNFTSDDQGRLWVAVKRGNAHAMLVIAQKT